MPLPPVTPPTVADWEGDKPADPCPPDAGVCADDTAPVEPTDPPDIDDDQQGSVATGGSGTVTNFSAGDLSPLFTTTETNTTTTPDLQFAQIAQPANKVFAGPATPGPDANPTFRSLVAFDIPDLFKYNYVRRAVIDRGA